MSFIDTAILSFENSTKRFEGNAPTNETEYNTFVSEQEVFIGDAPTWAEVQAKATELETAYTNEKNAIATDKANGNQKLLDLGLTQAEATALTGYSPPTE